MSYIPGFHIPGTLVPIGAVAAQQQAVAAQQQQDQDEEAFLLLLAHDQEPMAPTHKEGAPVVEYGILEFNRVMQAAHTLTTLTWDGGSYGPANEYRQKLKEVEEGLERRNRQRQAAVEQQRATWLRQHVKVRVNAAEEVQVSAFRKETHYFDEVSVDGLIARLPVGQAEPRISDLAEAKFPNPTPLSVTISEEKRAEVRSWEGSWASGGTYSTIPTPQDLQWNSIPTLWVLAELDAKAREGWRLLHVSVDHGLYKGRHARLAAGPESIRYTLGR